MDVSTISACASILVVFCGGFNYIVIKPLRTALESLQKSIDRLAAGVDDLRDRHNELKVRVVEVDARSKSNQHRIDRLEELLDRRKEE